MLVLSVILLNVLTAHAQPVEESNKIDNQLSSRVLYGDYADIREYPYFAFIEWCGAAIISEDWLVTAAHCIESGVEVEDISVWVGAETIEKSQLYSVDYMIAHPQYSNILFALNDIALLHLSRPLSFSDTVQPLALPEREYQLHAVHRFAGKGKDEHEYSTGTKYLMEMKVRTLEPNECLPYLEPYEQRTFRRHSEQLWKAVICTKRIEDNPGFCYGDSGSPLVRDNTLVGIASFMPGSTGNCSEPKVNFFTNVAPYVDWIKQITGGGWFLQRHGILRRRPPGPFLSI